MGYGIIQSMAKNRMRKLTVLVPDDLIRRATQATRQGITPTVRRGLQIIAAQEAYANLRKLRGKVKFGLTWQELRGEE
jgi:hypothetical protein